VTDEPVLLPRISLGIESATNGVQPLTGLTGLKIILSLAAVAAQPTTSTTEVLILLDRQGSLPKNASAILNFDELTRQPKATKVSLE